MAASVAAWVVAAASSPDFLVAAGGQVVAAVEEAVVAGLILVFAVRDMMSSALMERYGNMMMKQVHTCRRIHGIQVI